MKYFLSTIADADFSHYDETGRITFSDRTAAAAEEYGLGLELAEFCVSGNLDEGFDTALSHFAYNRTRCTGAVAHGPYSEMFPHAIDSLVARAAYERYDRIWSLCTEYSVSRIVLHANYVPGVYYPEWFISGQTAFWKDFLGTHRENITVCLENVMEPCPSLITDIIKGVDDERLRMCLDAGHANLTPISPIDWLEECFPYISHYHIHNNSGLAEGAAACACDMHSAPGCGSIDLKAFLDRAEELTPHATVTAESCDLAGSVRWLRENGYI